MGASMVKAWLDEPISQYGMDLRQWEVGGYSLGQGWEGDKDDKENKYKDLKYKSCRNEQSTLTNNKVSLVTANTSMTSVGLVSSNQYAQTYLGTYNKLRFLYN